MRILFTRSNLVMSRLIRWVTGEDVSHCAIEANGFVIHSNLKGIHAETVDRFEETGKVMYWVDIPDDYTRLLTLFCKRAQSSYDIGAMLYLGLRLLCPWLPKKNLWQCSGMYLCTEWVTEFLDGEVDSMITPYKLLQKLQGRALEP